MCANCMFQDPVGILHTTHRVILKNLYDRCSDVCAVCYSTITKTRRYNMCGDCRNLDSEVYRKNKEFVLRGGRIQILTRYNEHRERIVTFRKISTLGYVELQKLGSECKKRRLKSPTPTQQEGGE